MALPGARAADLLEVYEQAERNDPRFRQAAANKRAVLESRPQAYSQLLPDVRFSANAFTNDQDATVAAGFGSGGEFEFNSHGYELSLRQPVFHWDRFLQLNQADSSIKQADAQLAAARQELMVRVAGAYFDILAARDTLEFARAEARSLRRQLEQARQQFQVGMTAITNVQEAQAGYDRAVAQEIVAQNEIDIAREALREITGQYGTQLETLSEDLPLARPQPDDIEAWTSTAMQENLNVIAALNAVDRSREEIRVQRSGHLPTLDVVARHDYNDTGGRFGESSTRTSAIGLQLSVPLFQGGFVNSRTREAQHRLDEQLAVLEQTRREAHRQTRQAYLNVVSGISQIEALQVAITSSETALQATEAGFEVGTRTAVDVVAAERAVFEARRNYTQAVYNYIVNSLQLKLAAGILSSEDLGQINSWLQQ